MFVYSLYLFILRDDLQNCRRGGYEMEYLFIQIQHFLFICIFNLNFTFPTLIDLILHSRMKAINVKQMTVEAVGELYLCHQLSEF